MRAESHREKLSDAKLEKLQPAPKGKRREVLDTQVPGFGVRVTDRGTISFVVRKRLPKDRHATLRTIGEFPVWKVGPAREKAAEWLRLIEAGRDPQVEQERAQLEAQRRRKTTFRAVANDFIAGKLSKERKGAEVAREVRNELIEAWGDLPLTDITDEHVAGLVKRKARTAPGQARNLLGTAKRLFQWAVDQRDYGIKISPAAMLKPRALCGEKVVGDRVLSDDELRVLWHTARRMVPAGKAGDRVVQGYPYGAVYRLLMLTGLRLNEVADASWSEFDIQERTWTIPKERMKGKANEARAHVVPLTNDILELLDEIPRFKKGRFLFSTTFGASPAWISNKVKKRFDAHMLRKLRWLDRRRGNEPREQLEPWTNHDIRRTVRTRLSRLKVAEVVCEAVLAHVRPGIKKNYDHHDYLDEKREALMQWAAQLKQIVNPAKPTGDNVVPLRA